MRISWKRRHVVEAVARICMYASFLLVAGCLFLILWTVVVKGLPALTWEIISRPPEGGFYMGGSTGGILNAILGSLYMAGGGTIIALLFSLPLSLYLQAYMAKSAWASLVRFSLDVLWGIPSIVYGAFAFTIMLAMGIRASLLGGIFVLALLQIPIMSRSMDEVISRMPRDLEKAALALGSTRLEVAVRIVVRQMLPGIITAVLLSFGRGIGDAAAVLFTAGYTDSLPTSLMRPAASLPLAVFFMLGSPFPEVRQRAYAAALILTVIVLAVSICSRLLSIRPSRYSIK